MAHDHDATGESADSTADTRFRALTIALVINTIFFVVELSASYTHTLDFDCTFRSPKA